MSMFNQLAKKTTGEAHQERLARFVSDNSLTEELAGKVTLTGVRQENRSHTLTV